MASNPKDPKGALTITPARGEVMRQLVAILVPRKISLSLRPR
jgi:hypothetical protein